jgi:hypothetical protein
MQTGKRLMMTTTYLLSHCLPLSFSNLVLGNVIDLCEDEREYRQDVDANENFIACPIERLVIVAIDVGRDDAAELDADYHSVSHW